MPSLNIIFKMGLKYVKGEQVKIFNIVRRMMRTKCQRSSRARTRVQVVALEWRAARAAAARVDHVRSSARIAAQLSFTTRRLGCSALTTSSIGAARTCCRQRRCSSACAPGALPNTSSAAAPLRGAGGSSIAYAVVSSALSAVNGAECK